MKTYMEWEKYIVKKTPTQISQLLDRLSPDDRSSLLDYLELIDNLSTYA